MPPLLNLVGQKFGRLTVVDRAENDKHKKPMWLCLCDCGNTKIVKGEKLKRKDGGESLPTRSCGCYRKEVTSARSATHRLRGAPEYSVWSGMKARCTNPKEQNFEFYGGRGITFCERWSSFKSFYDDMGQRPTPKHSIDRVDVNGSYEPDNCRWATQKEQSENKRKYKSNKTGISGVRFDKNIGKFDASINQKRILITSDFFLACCARKSAENIRGNA